MAQFSLESVSVNGFRGLRHFRLEGLGRVNILVGENNSGKTSVLEALSILCNPIDPYEWLLLVRRRDFGRMDETILQSLRWCFHQQGQTSDLTQPFDGGLEMSCGGLFTVPRLSVFIRDVIGEPNTRRRQRSGRLPSDPDVPEPRRGVEITHKIDPSGSGVLEAAGVHEPRTEKIIAWEDDLFLQHGERALPTLKAEMLTPYSYQINRLQVRRLSASTVRRHREAMMDLIAGFDPEVQDVNILSLRGGRPSIYLNHRRLGMAPLSIFGDALRRAVLLATTLPTLGRGGLLMLDEIETGIHVTALGRVFRWLMESARSLGVQVIATTHSLEAVDALLSGTPDVKDDLVAYHLDQTPEQTRVRRFEGDLLARLRRERGLDVR
jgi:putative AbiEii toxin of type IV toxin-antitoxin system/AAA ATPase-like protein